MHVLIPTGHIFHGDVIRFTDNNGALVCGIVSKIEIARTSPDLHQVRFYGAKASVLGLVFTLCDGTVSPILPGRFRVELVGCSDSLGYSAARSRNLFLNPGV